MGYVPLVHTYTKSDFVSWLNRRGFVVTGSEGLETTLENVDYEILVRPAAAGEFEAHEKYSDRWVCKYNAWRETIRLREQPEA